MTTPIYEFISRYAASGTLRLHMPGHKGVGPLGCEALDITEIAGADALYEAAGIIRESEANAAALFGSGATFYSTEGASQCVRAMVHLALTLRNAGSAPRILAARNAHRSFLSACALCGADVDWLWPEAGEGLLACPVSPEALARALDGAGEPYAAVYVTSPDYLGNLQDVAGLAAVCHVRGLPLLVDNAHGAYLKFLERPSGTPGPTDDEASGAGDHTGAPLLPDFRHHTPNSTLHTPNSPLHPLDLGADLVCDSAHKTLPVLTGGAYLHVSRAAAERFAPHARRAMALFGSTSPSYLILVSLDRCNALLSGGWPERLAEAVGQTAALRAELRRLGWTVGDGDPLRVTVYCDGKRAAERLRGAYMEPEYAGPDALVLMLTPENAAEALERVPEALGRCELSAPPAPPALPRPERVCSPRGAMLAEQESVPAEAAVGRVCGAPTVGCPPAVPIAAAGERIPPEAIPLFRYYGVETVDVVRVKSEELWCRCATNSN